jgi:hypothetical protein
VPTQWTAPAPSAPPSPPPELVCSVIVSIGGLVPYYLEVVMSFVHDLFFWSLFVVLPHYN